MMDLPDAELGLRKAALALHALQAVDRDWLLAALPEPQRAALQPLLAELQALGLAPDAEVVRQALAAAPSPTANPHAEASTPSLAAALARTLEHEAPVLQGMFLAALSATERQAVLQHWSGPAPAAADPARGAGMAPALRDAIVLHWRNIALRAEEAL